MLEQVPEAIADKVKPHRPGRPKCGAPGINLLDARIFADRDRTADSVVQGRPRACGTSGVQGCSPSWNTPSRASTRPTATRATSDDEQFTLLDGLSSCCPTTRSTSTRRPHPKVSDPFLLDWWGERSSPELDAGTTRADALAPVQTRLSYYASSEKARAILGQPRSTIDLRQTILRGRRPAGVHRPGRGGPGRGRPGGRVACSTWWTR